MSKSYSLNMMFDSNTKLSELGLFKLIDVIVVLCTRDQGLASQGHSSQLSRGLGLDTLK